MDEENLERFLRDVISENAPAEDRTQESAIRAAGVLSAYYNAFMMHGFSEERAFQLTLFILSKILEGKQK